MVKRAAVIAAIVLSAGSVFGADFTGKYRAPNDAMVIELKAAGPTSTRVPWRRGTKAAR